jgi:tetratricopeptide (TPR) repeat protein
MKRLNNIGGSKTEPATKPEPVALQAPDPGAPRQPYDELLRQFVASVEEYQHQSPHLDAYAALQAAGDTADAVLSLEAAALWEKVIDEHTGDHVAMHHLAIIYHGNGYRMHFEGGSGERAAAIDHWRRGLQAWAHLVRDDAFWEAMRATWRDRKDLMADSFRRLDLDAFRRQIPRHLLNLHAAIVASSAQSKSDGETARQHVRLILESGFEPDRVEAARRNLYERLVGDVERLCQTRKGEEAFDRVESYLAVDPDYPLALADGLRACAAVASPATFGGPSGFSRAQQALERGKKWATHQALELAAGSSLHIAAALRDYFLECGTLAFGRANAALDARKFAEAVPHFQEAAAHLRRAVSFERSGDAARRCFRGVCIQATFCDINHNVDKIGKALIDALIESWPYDPMGFAMLAYYHYRREEIPAARRHLETAKRLNLEAPDSEASKAIADLDPMIGQNDQVVRVNNLLRQASQAAATKRYFDALKLLQQAESIDSENYDVHWNKARYLLQLNKLPEAKVSFAKAKRLLPPNLPEHQRQAMNDLASILD